MIFVNFSKIQGQDSLKIWRVLLIMYEYLRYIQYFYIQYVYFYSFVGLDNKPYKMLGTYIKIVMNRVVIFH
jgi:hypothetical protein